jgi:hypothetical protein
MASKSIRIVVNQFPAATASAFSGTVLLLKPMQ